MQTFVLFGKFISRKPFQINFVNRRCNTNLCLTVKNSPSSHVLGVQRNDKIVGKWLLACGGMVFGAVALGGVTRLTESGLSMVTWKFLGERVPRNDSDWNKEFERYQLYPEFTLKNSSLTLNEFKMIYYMEYAHRMWGRIIGIFFALPAVYFWKKNYLSTNLKRKILILGTLICSQGLMGWYMVKSGLEDRFKDANEVPRVSQYRLASHLGAALIIYSLFLSTALSVLKPNSTIILNSKGFSLVYKLSRATKVGVFITAISGAFVAGLDAGLVYNSFPKMGDNWIPPELLSQEPLIQNFTENPVTVQFDHRILGQFTVAMASFLWIASKRVALPYKVQNVINWTTAMAWIQAGLGITTLLTYVPVPIATAHQSGSLILLSLASWGYHELRLLKCIPK